MKILKSIVTRLSVTKKYRYQVVFAVAFIWVLVDTLYLLIKVRALDTPDQFYFFEYKEPFTIILRELIVFIFAGLMAYILVFQFRKTTRYIPLWLNFLVKTGMLIFLAFLMNFAIHFAYSVVISNLAVSYAMNDFIHDAFRTQWILEKLPDQVIIFLFIQTLIEMMEKYSPGIFLDIFFGKYLEPRDEKRIIMFIDLKDSTPIAEKLGNKEYFKFIRDFISIVSSALIEHNGRIYQYVGDEIVVSWKYNTRNAKKTIDALIDARKLIQRNSERFRRRYGIAPEFRVGIHLGDVTIGEIGVIKKDLAMSGDTMNTTARIRSACSELNQKFIVSKDVIDSLDLKDWQSESLGIVELKGKNNGIELFALKI
jgi:adenylate cyclase